MSELKDGTGVESWCCLLWEWSGSRNCWIFILASLIVKSVFMRERERKSPKGRGTWTLSHFSEHHFLACKMRQILLSMYGSMTGAGQRMKSEKATFVRGCYSPASCFCMHCISILTMLHEIAIITQHFMMKKLRITQVYSICPRTGS